MPESPPNLALDAVVQSLIVTHVGELVGELAELTCPDCGFKFMEFRAGGRLGCPNDYRVFGRGPASPAAAMPTAPPGMSASGRGGGRTRANGSGLRTRLREAIAREDYEEAARLRDLLRLKDADA